VLPCARLLPPQLFEHVAAMSGVWNGGHGVGLVVGATDTSAMVKARAAAPNAWILAPGIGAQGGELETAVASGLFADGELGLLVPISRGISKAEDPRAAALMYRDAINAARTLAQQVAPPAAPPTAAPGSQAFIDFALRREVLRFGEFKLKSGRLSPYFFNAGLFNTGMDLVQLGNAYASTIATSGIGTNVAGSSGAGHGGVCWWRRVGGVRVACRHLDLPIFGRVSPMYASPPPSLLLQSTT
jgi:hypothetical protein